MSMLARAGAAAMLGARRSRTRLVTFEDATFTRNSVAWYSKTPTLAIGSMVQAALSTPRIRVVGGLEEYLGELSRSNIIAGDSSRLDSASWGTFGAVVHPEDSPSIFDGEMADRVEWNGASSAHRIQCDLQGTSDGDTVVIGIWCRTLSGTKDFRLFVTDRSGAVVAASPTAQTATTTPRVIYATANLGAGATTPRVHVYNDALAGAGSIIIDHVQVEIPSVGPSLPSSPIRKSDGGAEIREADLMEFASLPQELIDGLWHVRYRSEFDSTVGGTGQALIVGSSSQFVHVSGRTALRARNTAGANTTLQVPSTSYAAGEAVECYGDFRDGAGGNSAMRTKCVTGGVKNVTGAHEPFAAGSWYLGQSIFGGLNGNVGSWFTEPRLGKALV